MKLSQANRAYLPTKRRTAQTPSTECNQLTTRSITSMEQQLRTRPSNHEESNMINLSVPTAEGRLKNWNNVFGDFLGDTLLRKRQQTMRKSTEPFVSPEYFKEAPTTFVSQLWKSPSNRRNFAKYLMGEIDADEFVVLKNKANLLDAALPQNKQRSRKPRINLQRYENQMKANRRAAVGTDTQVHLIQLINLKSEEIIKKAKLSEKFDKIRNVIGDKVQIREEEDRIKRSKDLKNLLVFKHMYDVSDDYIQSIIRRFKEKDETNQTAQQLQGQQINVIKHQNPYQDVKSARYQNEDKNKYEVPVEKQYIKNHIDFKAKEYMDDLRANDYIQNERVKKRIYLDYQFKKLVVNKDNKKKTKDIVEFDDYQIQRQNTQPQLNTPKQIVPFIQKGFLKNQYINNDLELIKYITNYPSTDQCLQKSLQQKAKQTLLNVDGLFKEQRQGSQSSRGTRIRKLRYNQTENSMDSRSNDESLNSMYELNVDTLYKQSRVQQNKLLEKQHTDGFSKTIRSIQKNQILKHTIQVKNIQKLEGQKVQ